MIISFYHVTYLLFRVAPIIIVSYFVLNSVFLLDLRGIVYLLGLILACFIASMITIFMTNQNPKPPNIKCHVITLGTEGPISRNPLSIVTYSYTLFYLLLFLINAAKSTKGLLVANLPILIIFPLLILAESYWMIKNDCLDDAYLNISVAIMVGGVVGIIMAMVIIATKVTQLQYIFGTNYNVCDRPSRTNFRCRPMIVK